MHLSFDHFLFDLWKRNDSFRLFQGYLGTSSFAFHSFNFKKQIHWRKKEMFINRFSCWKNVKMIQIPLTSTNESNKEESFIILIEINMFEKEKGKEIQLEPILFRGRIKGRLLINRKRFLILSFIHQKKLNEEYFLSQSTWYLYEEIIDPQFLYSNGYVNISSSLMKSDQYQTILIRENS